MPTMRQTAIVTNGEVSQPCKGSSHKVWAQPDEIYFSVQIHPEEGRAVSAGAVNKIDDFGKG